MSVIIALLVGAAAVVVLAAALWPRSVHIVIEKQRSYPPIARYLPLPRPEPSPPRARVLLVERYAMFRTARVYYTCGCLCSVDDPMYITRTEKWLLQVPRPAVFCRGCDQLVMEARP